MAQPELTDWAGLWFVAAKERPPASCLYVVNLTSFLLVGFGPKDLGHLARSAFHKLPIASENCDRIYILAIEMALFLEGVKKEKSPLS